LAESLERVLTEFVRACLEVFGVSRVRGIVLHGSALKGGAISGFSDIDFMVFLAPECFTAGGALPDEAAFAMQERIGPLPWRETGFYYPQAYFYDAGRMPEWWTGPVPGAYRVLHGSLPDGITATDERLRASAGRWLQELPNRTDSNLRNFADSDDASLPRRVRLIGTDVAPAIFVLLTPLVDDAEALWALSKLEALELLRQRFPDSEGPRLAERYYEHVAKLYGGEFDAALARETFRLAVGFLRWVESGPAASA
jgi:hypothetical protein